MSGEAIEVRIAEVKTGRAPLRFVSYGLGSCVGVTLYDRTTQTGGMAHVMLPEARLYPDRSEPGKFADTGIDMLLFELKSLGIPKERVEAKLTGGANMFAPTVRSAGLSIGLRNVIASRQHLAQYGIPVIGEDVGGRKGRTVFFDLSDGMITIRVFNQPTRQI